MKATTAADNRVDRVLEGEEVEQGYPLLTARWLEKARCRGDGPPFVKIGRKVGYRASAVEAWLDEQTRRSTSDTGPPRKKLNEQKRRARSDTAPPQNKRSRPVKADAREPVEAAE